MGVGLVHILNLYNKKTVILIVLMRDNADKKDVHLLAGTLF